MSKSGLREEEARRKAKEIWDKNKARDADVVNEREKERRAEAAKTARLRELRLAKEAADAKASAEKDAEKKAASPRRKSPK